MTGTDRDPALAEPFSPALRVDRCVPMSSRRRGIRVLEVAMLDKGQRDALREIERRIAAADPDLAALLGGERSLVGAGARTCQRGLLAPLALLAGALLVLW